ncbi:MAG: NAD(P)H-dependent oxidoreductase [Cyanobacteriota bacterium]|jgi:chromate reductase|nr:NAD(P)H-dependent oxidoreductase [Cyanobacteriota bacterium]
MTSPSPTPTPAPQSPVDVLVISVSSGANLILAERFVASASAAGLRAELLDLTALALPLYTARRHASEGIPAEVGELSRRLAAAPRWVICAPEYNGSIPPAFTSAVAWLSVQGDDFRSLFNQRPVAIATQSGGGGMGLLTALRLQLAHLGASVVGRQLLATQARPASDDTIRDLIDRLQRLAFNAA